MKTYTQRLRTRPIKEELQDLKKYKDGLFEARLENSKQNKSKPWKMIHLDTALKSLKNNKSRDPNGWVNEIFKDGALGYNLKLSLLHMLNKVKDKT